MPRPPSKDEAIVALQEVQLLSPEEFEKKIEAEIGASMLQIFNALARGLSPGEPNDAIAKKIHLMTLAWLMARSDDPKGT